MKNYIRANNETNSPTPGIIQPGSGIDGPYKGIAIRGGEGGRRRGASHIYICISLPKICSEKGLL